MEKTEGKPFGAMVERIAPYDWFMFMRKRGQVHLNAKHANKMNLTAFPLIVTSGKVRF